MLERIRNQAAVGTEQVMGKNLARVCDQLELPAPAAVLMVLTCGALTKLGHAELGIASLAGFCVLHGFLKRVLSRTAACG